MRDSTFDKDCLPIITKIESMADNPTWKSLLKFKTCGTKILFKLKQTIRVFYEDMLNYMGEEIDSEKVKLLIERICSE